MCESNIEGSDLEYYEEDEATLESCGNCHCIHFHMLAGGTLRCSYCGMLLNAFWIQEEGIVTKTHYKEEREHAN